jgi:cytochrome c-type biogenesis protein CcmF
MITAHLGLAVLVLGISIVSHYEIERDLSLQPGDSLFITAERLSFQSLSLQKGSNYVAHRAHFILESPQGKKTNLFPEKRVYIVQGTRVSETAIQSRIFSDIYIAMGESLGGQYWSFRIAYKPFIGWIWAGVLLMMLGGFLSMWGRRLKT